VAGAKKRKSSVKLVRAGGTWSEAKYWSFIRGALRRAGMSYPSKHIAKMNSRRHKPPRKKGDHRFEYQCVHCTKWFPDKEVDVDHIIGAGSLKSYEDLPGFVERLFCEPESLQILCKPCHKVKTNEERGSRGV